MATKPKTHNKSPKVAKKVTKVQAEDQVKNVFNLLLEGRSRTDILEHCKKTYNVERARADQLIAEATARIHEINKNTLQTNLGIVTNNQWELYRKAISSGNLALARQLLMDIAKLRGLDVATINHVIEDKRQHQDLSDEELDKLLEQHDPNS